MSPNHMNIGPPDEPSESFGLSDLSPEDWAPYQPVELEDVLPPGADICNYD